MTTKRELNINVHDCQHDVDELEIELGCANNILLVAKKELAEYQEPTMVQDTLCEVWHDVRNEVFRYFSHKGADSYYFYQHGATSKTASSTGHVKSWPNYKIIEEPGLPWKEIDNNVPEAKVYLVDPRDGKGFMLKYSKDAIEGIFEEGQYIILKE